VAYILVDLQDSKFMQVSKCNLVRMSLYVAR
jgi:hypothetical protein